MAPSTRLRIRLIGLAVSCVALIAAVPASPGQTKSTTDERARQKFSTAQRAYKAGDFEFALAAYSEAYELKPHPGFLFNIAQCHRHLGHYERAEFFYRQYLSLASLTSADSKLVRSLISEVEMRRAERERGQPNDIQDGRSGEPPVLAPSHETAPVARGQLEIPAQTVELNQVAAQAARTSPVPVSGATHGSQQLTKQWWFWTGIGVLVVGVGSSIYFASEPKTRATTLPAINGRPP